MNVDPPTEQNAPGRSFTCRLSHTIGNSFYVPQTGETGILQSYNVEAGTAEVLLWRNNHYTQGVARVHPTYLSLGPVPNANNTERYPFRCAKAYTTSSNQTCKYLAEGSVVRYDRDTGKALVSIPKDNLRMWVDIRSIHIGRDRKYGDIVIGTGLSSSLSANLTQTGLASTDYPLTRLLFPLLCGIMDQRGSLTWLPPWIDNILSSQAATLAFSRRLADGTHRAGISAAFDKNNNPWTCEQFINRGIKINATTRGTGLYLRCYRNFPAGQILAGAKPRCYVKKTTRSFGIRHEEHEKSTKNPSDALHNGNHYKIARQANERAAVVLMYLDNCSERETSIAEQCMILVMRAYRPEVINWVQRVVAGSSVPSPATTGSSALGSVISDLEDKEPATQLTQLSEDLWTKLGWKKFLDSSGGCNKESPLAQINYEKILWTMVEYPDRYVYYRPAYRCTGMGSNIRLFALWIQSAHSGGQFWNISRKSDYPHPADGNKIHLSVEIMKTGRHPHAYSRLPDIGIWSNWAEASQIALRVRWKVQEKGGEHWVEHYLQHAKDATVQQDPNVPGSIGVWHDMINFRYYLERKPVLNPPTWFEQWGTARVKELKFNHLTQTLQILDPPKPQPATVPAPGKDEAALKAAYRAIGFQDYGMVKTDNSLDFKALKLSSAPSYPQRTTCDLCYATVRRHVVYEDAYKSKAGTEMRDCRLTEDGTRCVQCHNWDHDCTFSSGDLVQNHMTALIFYPPCDTTPVRIDDPGFETHALED